ncbi:hypothetical protein D3C72_2117950 [compost metagenome]
MVCGSRRSNSWNFSGRLSSADGRRKPYSTRFCLRAASPLYIAPTCDTVTWLSSMNINAFFGK